MPSDTIHFWLNDVLIEESAVDGTTTLLRYLREHRGLPGTKEGCAEGDCGACTVAVIERRDDGDATFRAVNSCLMMLPMLQGKRVYTVEALRDRGQSMADSASGYHPAQRAMVGSRGSQCGYCTPGIVMSLFEATYRADMGEGWQVDDQLCGNLCRCTGYRPIREAGQAVAGLQPDDRFAAELRQHREGDRGLSYAVEGQTYLQPTSLAELVRLRAQHPGAVLMAGGTDLGIAVTKKHARWPVVIGLEGVTELQQLSRTRNSFSVGGGVDLTRLMEVVGAAIPSVHKHLRWFGSRQIRSRATVGGNLCNASPIGDTPPMWMALDAVVVAVGPNGERRIPIDAFFLDYRKTALAPDEVLLRVEADVPPSDVEVRCYKVSKRREMDISAVAAGMRLERDRSGNVSRVVLAYGGMAATPLRATVVEDALVGKPWTMASVETVLPLFDQAFTPMSDHRGSADYRALVAKNLLRGFVLETLSGAEHDSARPSGTIAAVAGGVA